MEEEIKKAIREADRIAEEMVRQFYINPPEFN